MLALSRVGLAALVVVALWAILILSRPGVTFHLAPIFAAAAPVLLTRYERQLKQSTALYAGVVGLVIALVATFAFSVAGRLDGPSLLLTGGATLESIVFAVVGAIAGVLIAWPWPRELGSAPGEQ
ncbi:MAG: hypothetical protein OEM67_05580 [Thermoleophilia bacterium]|nr:hypothetical protein [Thermoleophilia bacterium]MDH3725150.1 hypothetical protein [Thermoleophilia bacterium]